MKTFPLIHRILECTLKYLLNDICRPDDTEISKSEDHQKMAKKVIRKVGNGEAIGAFQVTLPLTLMLSWKTLFKDEG